MILVICVFNRSATTFYHVDLTNLTVIWFNCMYNDICQDLNHGFEIKELNIINTSEWYYVVV